GTQAQAAQAALAAINSFLSIAPRKYYAILGTVASGNAGGATATAIFQQQIPIIPAFCSAIANQITLGGAPPWPLTEMTPWYLDMVQHRVDYDPDYPGLGNNAGIFAN